MPIFLQDVEDRRVGTSGAIPYAEDEFPALFPYVRWNLQVNRYFEYWRYFTGDIWNETVPNEKDENGEPILKYPLQINYIKTMALKHNFILWGEIQDGPGPIVPMRINTRLEEDADAPTPQEKKKAKRLENFINRVWIENKGSILQYEGGLISQFLGGIVYKLNFDPDNFNLEYGIKIEQLLPDFFMPVWDTSDPDNLLEVYIVWRVPAREANLRFGYPTPGDGAVDPLYIEHWTHKKLRITIGGIPVKHTVNGEEIIYDDIPNELGFIPFVYIARERAGNFYGLSLIDDLKGLARELNARLADFGDSIHESVHRDIYFTNVTQGLKTIEMPNGRDGINMGVTNPTNGSDPEVNVVDPPQIADNLATYPDQLREQFARDAFTPKVADGEDEGSQRSALTLAFRMWPMTSMIRAQRLRWSNGLTQIAKMITRFAVIHELGNIDKSFLSGYDYSCDWPVMIPRDREQLVNEVVLALQTQMLTPLAGMKKLDLVQDPNEEFENLKEWLKFLSNMATEQAANAAKAKMMVQEPIASTGAEKEPS